MCCLLWSLVLSISFLIRSQSYELSSMLHLNHCSARLLAYRRNELYLAWLETWGSALSAVEMLVEKFLHYEASPQGEITFGPPTSSPCGATSANVVVSQPRSFSSSAWLAVDVLGLVEPARVQQNLLAWAPCHAGL